MHPSQLIPWLARGSQQPPVQLQDGAQLLQYGPEQALALQLVGGLGVLVAIAGAIAAVDEPVAAVLLPIGLVLWLLTRRERQIAVLLDDVAIGVRNAGGHHVRIPWDELIDLRYESLGWRWALRRRDGQQVRFPAFLRGADEFLRRLKQEVTPERWHRFVGAIDSWRGLLQRAKVSTRRSRRVPAAGGDD